MIVTTALLTFCLKLLLIPAYYSTDFEVHRNWLAITHSLPLKKWYFEETSEWTLDYPPLFAWFEYILSFVAVLFDKDILIIKNLNYASDAAIYFQRLSVIFTDFVYVYGAYRCCTFFKKSWKIDVVLPILLLVNPGLIMIDHIHFQYNGILYGFLLISIAEMLNGNYLKSAFWFMILLNMKHIYIYLAPAYFIYLLKNYCFSGNFNFKSLKTSTVWINTCKLGAIVIGIFVITFLPFLDHLPQVLSRLFPFKRGLCHAYWAPNIWALYNIVDKIALLVLSALGFKFNYQNAVMTGGLVQEYSHAVLPNITPITTMILTGVMMLPCVIKLWSLDKKIDFIRCVVICGLTSFLFGWHVHEKAILMAIIPLTILAILEGFDAKIFLILSTVGHYSLFPLLYPTSLFFVKLLIFLLFTTYTFQSLSKMYTLSICKYSLPLLNILESLYLLGLGFLILYENLLHYLLGFDKKFPFLPLMLTSVYCSIGIIYCWVRYYTYFLLRKNEEIVKTSRKNK